MTRNYLCVDCEKVQQTDGERGRLPSRCPEHRRLRHAYYMRLWRGRKPSGVQV